MQRASDILTVRKPGRLARIAAPVRANLPDRVWAVLLTVLGVAVLAVAGVIIVELWRLSSGVLARTGLVSFVLESEWDVVRDLYSALPFIYTLENRTRPGGWWMPRWRIIRRATTCTPTR